MALKERSGIKIMLVNGMLLGWLGIVDVVKGNTPVDTLFPGDSLLPMAQYTPSASC